MSKGMLRNWHRPKAGIGGKGRTGRRRGERRDSNGEGETEKGALGQGDGEGGNGEGER